MTAIFQTNTPTAGKTTVRFTWAADTAKVQTIVGNFAQLLHSRGLGPVDANGVKIPFANLTNQQKLNIVDEYLLDTIRGNARQRRLKTAIDTATDAVLVTPEQDEFDG